MLERKNIKAIDVEKIFEHFLAIFVQVKGNTTPINVESKKYYDN